MFYSINQVSFHVSEYGDDHKETLLLLHGFTSSGQTWHPFIEHWSDCYRVIVVDLIGHGRTDHPAEADRYTMGKAVADLTGLLDILNIQRTHVLGYSMGGRVALSLAARIPERIHSVILESSSPGLANRVDQQARREQDHALADRIESIGIPAFNAEWERLPLFASQSSAVQEKLRRERLANSEQGLANSLRGMGTGEQPSLWHVLSQLNFPVLLLAGAFDEKFCRIAQQMASRLAVGQFYMIEQTGHTIHVENPEIFDNIVSSWLSQKERMF